MRIGVLTGGGDCPGLNAVIRAVVRKGEGYLGHNIVAIRRGFRGAMEGELVDIGLEDVRNILALGGTIIRTARCHPHREPGGIEMVVDVLEDEHIDALICIGGDGTLDAAHHLAQAGVPIVGVPKTIDNDVVVTDRAVGFDTAVNIATDAIDRLHTTAESHDRVVVVEVMGRHAGWIAVSAGIASGADAILIPEDPFDMEEVAHAIERRHRQGKLSSIIAVAEGAVPQPGSLPGFEPSDQIEAGAVSGAVRDVIAERTGFDVRLTVLGYVQRGGTPTPADRLLGTRFGAAAIDAVDAGNFGMFTALQGDRIELVPLSECANGPRQVPEDLRELARVLAT